MPVPMRRPSNGRVSPTSSPIAARSRQFAITHSIRFTGRAYARRVRPTPFPDLNDVLAEFVEGLRRALGHGLVGAYLVGSFALGDADEHSDVDFIVVTAAEVTDAEIASLNALHGRLFALESPWAQHLEGSYVPAERFRRLDPTCAPF